MVFWPTVERVDSKIVGMRVKYGIALFQKILQKNIQHDLLEPKSD